MKIIRIFLSENFHFLVVKFSVYLNRPCFRNGPMSLGTSAVVVMRVHCTSVALLPSLLLVENKPF